MLSSEKGKSMQKWLLAHKIRRQSAGSGSVTFIYQAWKAVCSSQFMLLKLAAAVLKKRLSTQSLVASLSHLPPIALSLWKEFGSSSCAPFNLCCLSHSHHLMDLKWTDRKGNDSVQNSRRRRHSQVKICGPEISRLSLIIQIFCVLLACFLHILGVFIVSFPHRDKPSCFCACTCKTDEHRKLRL